MKSRRLAILGSTGSIGRQTLDVVRDLRGLEVCALAAGRNAAALAEQVREFAPPYVALASESPDDEKTVRAALPDGATLLTGPNAMEQLVRAARPDVLLSGVVGAAGLKPTLTAIECGATLAIANKETLVMAGAIVMPAARKAGLDVLPVDSEHSAIFQCMASGRRDEVRRVTITASGGALRDWDEESAANASVKDALNHPTWDMGPKITIDSATLMNKALEIVEAHWLFDLPAEQIHAVLHPESIVHSYVEFCDGSVIAQMGKPDMTVPIAYALAYPQRATRGIPSLDLPALGQLTFRPLPPRFRRAAELGFEVIRRGGLTGAAMNSANEAAVEAFLAEKISLGRIVPIVEDIVKRCPSAETVTLEALQETDVWAREEVQKIIDNTEPAGNRGHITNQ